MTHRFVEKGPAVMTPFLASASGSDYDFWTAMVARFANDGLDEVRARRLLAPVP